VSVAMFSKRDSEGKSGVKSVAIDLANIVVYATRANHRAGNAGINRQLGGEFADILSTADDDFVPENEFLELVEKLREPIDNLFRPGEPLLTRVQAAAAETHVIAHHSRTG